MALQLLDEGRRIEVKDLALKDADGADIPGGDPETVYIVKQIPPAVNRRIAKAHTTSTINRKTGSRETVLDQEAFLDDLLDFALVDWRGVVHQGQPVQCTAEYKSLLDFPRKAALLRVAGLNQSEQADAKESSFRSTAKVL